MRIVRLELGAPAGRLDALRSFYGHELGFAIGELDTGFALRVGGAELVFRAAGGEPFHHFALLVPDGRFDAAVRWLETGVEALRGRDGNTVFDFSAWEARALYFHDPAGNIVELIEHAGLAANGRPPDDDFAPGELAGISEAALIAADPAARAEQIAAGTGVPVWDGDESAGILFAGERGHTLVISRTGRGLMPTRRPGEEHPLAVTIQRDDGSTAVVEAP